MDGEDSTEELNLSMPDPEEEKEIAQWEVELAAALRREKSFRKEAKRAVKTYEARDEEQIPYNILYSNVETLSPAVYNSLPRPVVMLKDRTNKDPTASVVSVFVERLLVALMDPGNRKYSDLNELARLTVNSGLVAGRGVLRFKYETDETFSLGEALPGKTMNQWVCGQFIPYDRFRHGYGRTWDEVPWQAFDWYFTEVKFNEQFPGFGELVTFSAPMEGDTDESSGGPKNTEEEGMGNLKLCHVIEVWDKEKKRVVFYSPSYKGRYLKQEEDPLELTGFFSAPQPLAYFSPISSLCPRPLHVFYKTQMNELNVLSERILALSRVIKIRGGYDSNVAGLEKMLEAGDNELVAVEGLMASAGSGTGGTVDKVIYLVPVEKHVAALQILLQLRESVKQIIYEITGISDILRGSSVASETATAQNIKNNWGTLRLKRFQRSTADYLRDCLRMMAEIALERMPLERLFEITGIDLPTQAEIEETMKAAQAKAQQTGQPMPPTDDVSKAPTKEGVAKIIKSDFFRSYTIDIETNSTVDAEASEDKQNITEFMNAFGQFMNSMAPLIADGTMPFEAMKAMLLAITRRFHMGPEVEGYILQMKPPQPQENPADQMKMQAEQMKIEMLQMQSQADAARLEQEATLSRAELDGKLQLMAAELELDKAKLALAYQQLELDKERMTMEVSAAREKHDLDSQMRKQKAAAGPSSTGE